MTLVFFIAESSIGSTTIHEVPVNDFYLSEPAMTNYIVEEPLKEIPKPKEPIKQQPERQKVTVIKNEITVVDNTAPTKTETPAAATDAPVVNNATPQPKKAARPHKKYSTKTVEFVPIFPGCETMTTNKQRVDCMSSKIKAFISRNFNTEKFSDAIQDGSVQRINVQFKINASGNVTDIKTRSKFQPLENEAIRVIDKLPFITPGKQGDRNVDVIYNVPIVFKMGY